MVRAKVAPEVYTGARQARQKAGMRTVTCAYVANLHITDSIVERLLALSCFLACLRALSGILNLFLAYGDYHIEIAEWPSSAHVSWQPIKGVRPLLAAPLHDSINGRPVYPTWRFWFARGP